MEIIERAKPVWEAIKTSLFVLGSAVVGIIAARNSFHPYFTRLWGASHTFWGTLWTSTYDAFGRDDFMVHVLGTTLVSVLSYVLLNAVFLTCDYTGKPAWLLKYKVQEGKNTPVDPTKLWGAVKVCAFNTFVTSPIFTLAFYPLTAYVGAYHKGDLPTFERVLLEFVVFALVEEVGFYYSHRLLHRPNMYAKYHKTHHEWTAPICITSVYCGKLEMLLSNLIPMSVGPLIMRSHLLTTWLWITLVVFSTTIAHGGYHVPFLFSPEAHDYHHKVFNCWFGTLGILDRLHKTDRPFAGSIEEKRHIVLSDLTPVKELFPDPEKPAASACTAEYTGEE